MPPKFNEKKGTPAKAVAETKAEKPKKRKRDMTGVSTKTLARKVARDQIRRALKAKGKLEFGAHTNKRRKIMTKARFRRPRTLRTARNPRDRRFEIPKRNKMDAFRIIQKPVTTEAAMKKIEDNDTLVFYVDRRSNKPAIKAAVEKLYNIKVARVNTLNCPRNVKKAYVKLPRDLDALDVANRIGII